EPADRADRVVGDPDAAVVQADMLHREPARRHGERRERDDGNAKHDGSNKPTPAKPHTPQAPLPCADAIARLRVEAPMSARFPVRSCRGKMRDPDSRASPHKPGGFYTF